MHVHHRPLQDGFLTNIGQKAASVGAAALLSLSALSGAPAALASEFDVLAEAPPSTHYYVDDANVLSRATRSEIDKKLKLLDVGTRSCARAACRRACVCRPY